jgi:glycosyltransferase involved in cell wall biosynthesis
MEISESRPLSRKERRGILFVGRLDAQKGVRTVIETAARLPDIPFEVIGSGPEEADVQRAASSIPNLSYLGPKTPREALSAMASSIAVVVPSDWEEPFGRVAIEAMSVGTVPLVSDRGELPHIARAVDHDLVVERGDWSQAVARIVGLRDREYEAASTLCRREVASVYSTEAGGRALMRIYRSVR